MRTSSQRSAAGDVQQHNYSSHLSRQLFQVYVYEHIHVWRSFAVLPGALTLTPHFLRNLVRPGFSCHLPKAPARNLHTVPSESSWVVNIYTPLLPMASKT